MTEENALKVRENRARRILARRGEMLMKSRRRDPHALDYAGYMIISPFHNKILAGAHPNAFSLTLDEVFEWIAEGAEE